jgi:hypothetical protein
MKNVHLITTNKPSRLTLRVKTNELIHSYKVFANNGVEININQDIYITNDEEIKEGDCYIYLGQINKRIRKNTSAEYPYPHYQKIIITTDEQLINDGVQPIDDKFLEWFVKNPICEWVELYQDKEDYGSFQWYSEYKIIIPSEEPKQSIQEFIKHHGITEQNLIDGYKQGLQLIFENASKIPNQEVAKQNPTMYSEEEVLTLLIKSEEFTSNYNSRTDLKKWFDRNKKK